MYQSQSRGRIEASARGDSMPLLKFHLPRGGTSQEIQNLLDTVHRVMVATFCVPDADRYQLVTEYGPTYIRAEDTGDSATETRNFWRASFKSNCVVRDASRSHSQ